MHVLYSLHRHTREYAGLQAQVQHFHTREKKPIELRIKPVPRPTGTNSHPNPHPIGFLPAGTRVKCATVDCNRIQCATVRARVRARAVGAPDSLHDLSSVPPDSPEAHKSELQRSNLNGWLTWLVHRTVSGDAPDCPVRHATAAFQRPFLVVGAINTPTTPHSMASKFLHFYTLQEL
jgi:hypothetical protein